MWPTGGQKSLLFPYAKMKQYIRNDKKMVDREHYKTKNEIPLHQDNKRGNEMLFDRVALALNIKIVPPIKESQKSTCSSSSPPDPTHSHKGACSVPLLSPDHRNKHGLNAAQFCSQFQQVHKLLSLRNIHVRRKAAQLD